MVCELGWDFSSCWFVDYYDLKMIEIINIVLVDLNCLFYNFERIFGDFYWLLGKD